MQVILNDVEVRVLGSLMEKQITTPEYYPLSLNALTNACNQKTSRDPVAAYDEARVAQALETLRDKGLAQIVRGGDYRVPKHQQSINQFFNFAPQEVAVLCVLMLRGPQTAGEIRSRSSPLHRFEELEEVEATLRRLMHREPQPLATKLPRQLGLKEPRYAHLLSGEMKLEEFETLAHEDETAGLPVSKGERLSVLEEEMRTLRRELTELKERFDRWTEP